MAPFLQQLIGPLNENPFCPLLVRCQDSSAFLMSYVEERLWWPIQSLNKGTAVRFLRIDPMVSGSNPNSAKLSLRVGRVASSLLFQV